MQSLAKFHVKCRFSLQNTLSASKRYRLENAEFSLAIFHVKCRFYLKNTVSAAKLCKDWKMHSLAKFHVKYRISLENTVSLLKDVETGKCKV